MKKKLLFWARTGDHWPLWGGTSRETCARHVRRAISPASLNLEGYKLAWANPCPNPGQWSLTNFQPNRSRNAREFADLLKNFEFPRNLISLPHSADFSHFRPKWRQPKTVVSVEVHKHPGSPGQCLSWRATQCNQSIGIICLFTCAYTCFLHSHMWEEGSTHFVSCLCIPQVAFQPV